MAFMPWSSTSQGRIFPHSVPKAAASAVPALKWSLFLIPDQGLAGLLSYGSRHSWDLCIKGSTLDTTDFSCHLSRLGHGLPSDLRDICNILGLYPLGVSWSPPHVVTSPNVLRHCQQCH